MGLEPGATLPSPFLPTRPYRTLTVSDNGIGMSERASWKTTWALFRLHGNYKFRLGGRGRQDLRGYRHHRTVRLGFSSAFMVADHITVVTKKYGEEQAWK